MNAKKICYSTDPKCTGYKSGTYLLSGKQLTPASNSSTSAYIELSDGVIINGAWIDFGNSFCNDNKTGYCGNFPVDINGPDKPNTIGKDIFYFRITKSGIYPHGGPYEINPLHKFPQACNTTSTSSNNGYACAAWVIYNENMDYLHCDDLGWGKKGKCK